MKRGVGSSAARVLAAVSTPVIRADRLGPVVWGTSDQQSANMVSKQSVGSVATYVVCPP